MEKFIAGTEPTREDDWYVEVTIDAHTGLLATAACSDQTIQKVFLKPPSEYAAWLASAGYETPPDRDCEGKIVASNRGEVTILSPLDGDEFVIDPLFDDSFQRIPFVAGGGSSGVYRWNLNGREITVESSSYLWDPEPGDYILSLDGAGDETRFRVR
jgi:hypothetical protein